MALAKRSSLPSLPSLSLPTRRGSTRPPRSTGEKRWLAAGGVLVALIFLVAYSFAISPQRASTADVQSQIATTQDANAALLSRIATLRSQNANLAKFRADLATARLALPDTSEVTTFVRTLQSIGTSTQANVTSLTVGAATAPNGAAATPTPSATPTASGSSAAATGAASPASSVYSLPVTAQVSGSASALGHFLQQLQSVQPRAVLVTGVVMAGGTGGQAVAAGAGSGPTLQLTMQVFVDPSVTAATPSAAGSATPSATASATASATPSAGAH